MTTDVKILQQGDGWVVTDQVVQRCEESISKAILADKQRTERLKRVSLLLRAEKIGLITLNNGEIIVTPRGNLLCRVAGCNLEQLLPEL